MPLHEQAPQVRAPSIPRPPQHLLQEPPIRLHRAKQLRLLAALDIRVPPVADHPPREELVVARVELVLAQPVIMRESVEKLGVLEDDGAVRGCTPGETGNAAINVCRGGDFDVSNGEAERREDLPDRHPVPTWLHTLTRPHTADLLVLETGEGVREERRRPNGVVVGKHDDIRRRILDPMAHLQSFVRKRDGQHTNALRVDLVGKVLQGPEHLLLGDDEDFLGLADEPAVCGLLELFAGVDGGDDDGDILGGDVGRVFWEGDRAVDRPGYETYAVPEVAVEPGRWSVC